MRSPRVRRRSRFHALRPFAFLLLVSSFGILFAGCKGPEDAPADDFVFTEDDVARFRELANDAESGSMLPSSSASGAMADEPYLGPTASGSGNVNDDVPVLDLTLVPTYTAIRTGPSAVGDNLYRVTNAFLNVRSQPSVTAETVTRLVQGDTVEVLEFIDAAWARVKTSAGTEGYISQQYVSKLTSEEKLADEKKKFEGQYFVNFQFVNVRKEPSQQSEKLGEIPGQAIVRPISMDGEWARVPFEGKEGFVSQSYLAPFLPKFIVRQETFTLPVLHYHIGQEPIVPSLIEHVKLLKQQGMTIITFRGLRDLLLRQEERDVRLDPNLVVLAVTGLTAENIRSVSDALLAEGVNATLFLETKHVGLTGITEKSMLTLLANGFDIQSAGHTGDDLRALTNAQVQLELAQSRKILEEVTHAPVFAIAYPQGGVNDRVMQMAAEAGYLLGMGSSPERTFTRSQLLRMPSFLIFPTMSAEEVGRIVKGAGN